MKKKLKELAILVNGEVVGDEDTEISGIAPIEVAKSGEITFIANSKYLSKLKETNASCVIVSREIICVDKTLLRVENPLLAFAKIMSLFCQKIYKPIGIDPNAWVSKTAKLGKDISIYPYVYIGDGCILGDRVIIFPGVYLGEDSVVGEDSIIYSNVSIYPNTVIGRRVIIHSGAVIGADGFGFVKDGKKNVKIPQVGIVIIEDDVEIGANTTIDRATMGKTIIHSGVKIDNLVVVAHNVEIGEDSLIVAQVGIAGSTKVGKNVTLGGQVGLRDHINIGDNVRIGAQSGVAHDLKANGEYTGSPAIDHHDFLRMAITLPKIPEMRRALIQIERRLRKVEEIISSKEKEK
jgi:UDP-3-O-[3-hydroxymyristoyl] glucosamine N-acyltransferase